MGATREVQGRTVNLPLVVEDAAAGLATYEVDAAAARALVPDAFEVVESAPGRCHLAVATVDYRRIEIGHYLEVGITFFVRPAGAPSDGSADGTFIWKLPVDLELSRAVGCDIWGFPKTVERIERVMADDGSSVTTHLAIDDQTVFRLTVPRGGSEPLATTPMTTYTLLDGRPHATTFTQGGTGTQLLAGGDGVELELGDHPVAKELANLGLPSAPVMSMWIEHMTGAFGAPQPL